MIEEFKSVESVEGSLSALVDFALGAFGETERTGREMVQNGNHL